MQRSWNQSLLAALGASMLLLPACKVEKPRVNKSESNIAIELYSKFDQKTPKDEGFQVRAAADAFKPITRFPLVHATKVGNRLKAEDLVLGIELAGESRAYPIQQLCGPKREIINDQLAGRSIAATW